MALTKRAGWKTRRPGLDSFVVKTSEVIYDGAIVGIGIGGAGDGTCFNYDDVATTRLLGTAIITDDTTGTDKVTGDGTVRVNVDTSGAVLVRVPVTGAAAVTDVGNLVYCDDNVFTDTAGTSPAIGYISRWYTSTTCDVQLYSAAEARAHVGT